MQHGPKTQFGFTLIEMIVALAVFSTVVTVSVGALLVLVGTNDQLQSEQSVITNLSFAIDSMAREIRTGTHYSCHRWADRVAAGGPNNIFNDANDMDSILGDDTDDCYAGNNNPSQNIQGIAFKEGGDSISGNAERIAYFYDATDGKLYRRIGDGDAQSIVSSGIYISDAEFYVSGSEPMSAAAPGDEVPPTVTIFVEAREIDDPSTKTYEIQTTVTQRTLDI